MPSCCHVMSHATSKCERPSGLQQSALCSHVKVDSFSNEWSLLVSSFFTKYNYIHTIQPSALKICLPVFRPVTYSMLDALTCCPERVPLGDEPTRRVDDVLAAVGVVAGVHHLAGLRNWGGEELSELKKGQEIVLCVA